MALHQLASLDPTAAPTNYGQELLELGDGRYSLRYPTGEIYTGTPAELSAQVVKASIADKKWGRELNAENKRLKQQLAALQSGQAQPQPNEPQ